MYEVFVDPYDATLVNLKRYRDPLRARTTGDDRRWVHVSTVQLPFPTAAQAAQAAEQLKATLVG